MTNATSTCDTTQNEICSDPFSGNASRHRKMLVRNESRGSMRTMHICVQLRNRLGENKKQNTCTRHSGKITILNERSERSGERMDTGKAPV